MHEENYITNELPSLEVLLASIYYLMTRYVRLPDPEVSKAIIEHLEMLERHPDCESEILANVGRRLALQWRNHVQAEQYQMDKCKLNFSENTLVKLH